MPKVLDSATMRPVQSAQALKNRRKKQKRKVKAKEEAL